MAYLNENYLKLQTGYLFPEIARRVREFCEKNPEAAKKLIRCGIGDVTEPLPRAAMEAMWRAVDELGRRETFRGYGPEQGYEFLRSTIAQHDYRDRKIDIADDEIFLSDGSKCDCGYILDILGDQNKVAITDPVYPVYVDTNVMAGHTGPARKDGSYEGIMYLPCTAENIPGALECAIELRSFSKNGGFTGVRCGFTVMSKSLLARTENGRRLPLHPLWHRRWSTKANSVSYLVQRGAEALYSPEGRKQVRALIDHYMGNAKILRDACAKIGLKVYGGVNAPYIWVQASDGLTSWQMFDRMLREINVVITPGSGFGARGEGYFRISAFNRRENAEEVAQRLQKL